LFAVFGSIFGVWILLLIILGFDLFCFVMKLQGGLETDETLEDAALRAFDVKVTREARELSDELGVKVFMTDIIYHLFD